MIKFDETWNDHLLHPIQRSKHVRFIQVDLDYESVPNIFRSFLGQFRPPCISVVDKGCPGSSKGLSSWTLCAIALHRSLPWAPSAATVAGVPQVEGTIFNQIFNQI